MAQLLPSELDAAAARDPSNPELATLRLLESTLPGEFTVYHGVHWAKAGDHGSSYYGEIDFVVVDRLGRALAIEQKNGAVRVESGVVVKDYPSGPKSVRAQVSRNINHLMSEFGRRHAGRRLGLDHLVYLPDFDASGIPPAAVDGLRIVDARERQWLGDRIVALFDARGGINDASAPDPWSVHQFFSERIEVTPNAGALHELARAEFARLSGGLATWVGRLSLDPFRLRVTGTAGSGKTQLALQELRAAHIAGETALYVCFNRALADAMRALAPASIACMTFHELGARAMTAQGERIDWSAPGIFDRLAQAFVAQAPELSASVDVLVVDEGQDFEPAWADALLPMVRDAGRAVWLEDPSQNLYRREPVRLAGWAGLHSPVCWRSPRIVVALIDGLALADAPMIAGSAIHGFDPELTEYEDGGSAVAATDAAVRRLLALGHDPAHVAVVSFLGLARSLVVRCERLGGVATRRFTGGFTEEGAAVCTDGPLEVDTLFRFKGRSADCVVVTEVDFSEWTDDVRRRLFVALTRARLRVDIVATRRAARAIEARMA